MAATKNMSNIMTWLKVVWTTAKKDICMFNAQANRPSKKAVYWKINPQNSNNSYVANIYEAKTKGKITLKG